MRTKKSNAGRPTKYCTEMQAKADAYADSGWSDVGDVIPSAAGLCLHLGIARPTLHDWESIYPQFSATLGKIKSLQERLTLNKGITGEFNSTIAKLVLANHGYSEKQAVDHTSSDNSMSPTRIVIEAAGDNGKDKAAS